MIYLDNHATTKIDPLVLSEMMPYLTELYGNPSSRYHSFGWEAERAVENAREQVAKLINADPHEIIFTSGATESNNMVIKCTKSSNIVTTYIEHSSILKPIAAFADHVIKLNVGYDGVFTVCYCDREIDFVSVMLANNETGVIQPISNLKESFPNAKIHSDMAQALGKIPINIKDLDVDYASFSGHKLYGPKGVGALYIKDGTDNCIFPLLHGGGHEKGLRAGTQNVPSIVGFGKACELAKQRLDSDYWYIKTLKHQFYNCLLFRLGGDLIKFYGESAPNLPGCLCFSLKCGNMDVFLTELGKNVAISSGSACLSLSGSTSYVLTAMQIPEEEIKKSIRVSIGRFNTESEILEAVDYIVDAFNKSFEGE